MNEDIFENVLEEIENGVRITAQFKAEIFKDLTDEQKLEIAIAIADEVKRNYKLNILRFELFELSEYSEIPHFVIYGNYEQ